MEGNNEVNSQVLEICKENQTDFKELVLKFLKENKDIQKNIFDLIPQIKGYSSNSHNTITNNTTNNKTTKGRFKKPLISDISNYIEERGNLINANKFFDYYESNGWKVGKNKMKCWKAAVRNWENMRKDKGQMESKVMERLSSHDKAKQMLKNMHNGN